MRAGAVLALLLCVSVFYFQQIRSALMFVVSVGGHIGPPLHVVVVTCNIVPLYWCLRSISLPLWVLPLDVKRES